MENFLENLDSILRVLESPVFVEVFAIFFSWIFGSKWFKSKKLEKIRENASAIYHQVNDIAKKSQGGIEKTKEYLNRIDSLIKSYGYATMNAYEKSYASAIAQEHHDQEKQNKMDFVEDIARIAYLSVEEYQRQNTSDVDSESKTNGKTDMFLSILDSFLKARNYTPLNSEQKEVAKGIANKIHFEEKTKLLHSAED